MVAWGFRECGGFQRVDEWPQPRRASCTERGWEADRGETDHADKSLPVVFPEGKDYLIATFERLNPSRCCPDKQCRASMGDGSDTIEDDGRIPAAFNSVALPYASPPDFF